MSQAGWEPHYGVWPSFAGVPATTSRRYAILKKRFPYKVLEHSAGLAQLYTSIGGVYWETKEMDKALAAVKEA